MQRSGQVRQDVPCYCRCRGSKSQVQRVWPQLVGVVSPEKYYLKIQCFSLNDTAFLNYNTAIIL
jgi:hypothetical protein